MDRRKIERITVSIAVVLLYFLTVGFILFTADSIFGWDIFPPDVEKAIGFILLSTLVIIISSVLVNVMINLSIIALNTEEMVENSKKK